MRTLLSLVLLFAGPAIAFADPLVMTVTNLDEKGKKYEKNLRRMTIQMVHSADLERRLINFLKTHDLFEPQPWRQWQAADRKDGDIVTYTVFLNVTPGFATFRMVTDTAAQKVFVVDGLASIAGMQVLSGDDFQLYTLGREIVFGPRKNR